MYDKDVALKIVERVNEEKHVLISDYSDLIAGFNTVKYYYSNEDEKNKHSKIMIKQGYELSEQAKEGLYVNLMSSKNDNVYIVIGIYIKYSCYKSFIK